MAAAGERKGEPMAGAGTAVPQVLRGATLNTDSTDCSRSGVELVAAGGATVDAGENPVVAGAGRNPAVAVDEPEEPGLLLLFSSALSLMFI